MNHINLVLEDFDASVAHMKRLYGAFFMMDMPQPELHACLIEMGRVIFEFFVPNQYLPTARYGPHYVGLEYHADMVEVRKAVADRNIRVVRDIGLALHTHPADCFGIAFEFYDGYFHDREWPLLGGKMKPAEYWRNEHPLGLTGLKRYSVAVHDIDAASKFFQSFVSARAIYDEARPQVAGRAIGLQVSDDVVELMTPTGDGPLRKHLHRYGDGIRSTVFGVRNLEQARSYFTARGIEPLPGDAPKSIAIPAEANMGVIFEFAD